jgi:hypothetical protein
MEEGDDWGALVAQLVAHRHLDRTKALGEIEKQLAVEPSAAAPWTLATARIEADLLRISTSSVPNVPWEAVQGALAASESWVRHGRASEPFLEQLLTLCLTHLEDQEVRVRYGKSLHIILFYFILFYFILFYFILFYFILFYFILFYLFFLIYFHVLYSYVI